MVELFQEPIRRRYYANSFSAAYCYFLASVSCLVILPFMLSYSSYGLWLKTNTYREQPLAAYKYKCLITLHGADADGVDKEFFYSTMGSVNALRSESLRMATVRSRETDENLDSIPDELMLEVLVPMQAGETVRGVDAVIFFDYMLQDRAKIQMESLAFMSYSSGLPGDSLFTSGDLLFHQNTPLPIRGGFVRLYDDDQDQSALLDPRFSISAADSEIKTILASYSNRNFTTTLSQQFELWGRHTPSVIPMTTYQFNMTAKIKFPQQEILYIPAALEVVRGAWVAYLSMFVVVGFFLEKLSSFVYFHQIVETKMLVETMSSQTGAPHHKRF
jgi:hypothetical protein